MARVEFHEIDEPAEPGLLRRLSHRFWLWRRGNPDTHVLVVEPRLEDEGTWGNTDFDAWIKHPDECYEIIDDGPLWRKPMLWWARCDMEDYLETVEPNDWPDAPFQTPVHVNGEVVRGFDYTEYDAWLEPIGGWPDEEDEEDA